MRLFIALDIDEEIRARISAYMDRARALAPHARWARVEGLHVTLKFIGHVQDERGQEIQAALSHVQAGPFPVKFANAGFFPHAKAARICWIGVDGGESLPSLASAVDAALEKIGIAREEKPYTPHLTLARASSSPLRELQTLLQEEQPQFGTMTAREFFLYESQPQRGGSKYTKLKKFVLG